MADDMSLLYDRYWNVTLDAVDTNEVLAVAAVMLSQALTLYRTALSEDDYDRIIESISELKDRVTILGNQAFEHTMQ
ncbi:hypothetical protein UFOVP1146_212 [uncultured Caudovirales phage]|uniref:Uncharacterized protein n=1 Tax=uncultured Caudovirales phage TaxID=2100421 RepID=A0A6J5P0E2_9CAUD|nr:hypothetical protein UFOVP812_125 [uncultured Caudovirales phage]CAB4165279.1 hypothetical protein UFOVP818_18 [uncultured Caudovirales phage]CAB4186866.1 hypothetical protein UFOVP1146_212 [uncultured Caudovirales phage]CAB4221504.1 hypothetical protein UFOVP1638_353 [uncultured Caudovirales phage]